MRLSVAFALALWALPAAAEQVDCEAALSTADMLSCADAALNEADTRLEALQGEVAALLQVAEADMSPGLRDGTVQLEKAQEAFLIYRDAACRVEGWPMRGGSGEPLLVYGCMLQMTLQRIADLEAFLEIMRDY
ncbi:DUF1311 domain-containing protein [Xinfangfangia sp. D13-10-4-6]|uniref:lysozyme inhibitor LprI family protein n=1 Tax=Pseudogemmobacter hezensis TaxID=2737662 RepID=UPI00155615A1|nr:lysozyme inhibitor LprI family protein [Pseudogemmobacter hezensis]NPD15264.1 DUF1311 domain-containing protein [Pseudogemmobacter hezensis]